jgi:hypothetical protein
VHVQKDGAHATIPEILIMVLGFKDTVLLL